MAIKLNPILKAAYDKARENNARGNNGYVTYTPEIRDILSQLTDRVPWNVFLDESQGYISFTIKAGFTLDKESVIPTPLPTEPGLYMEKDSDWNGAVYRLDEDGNWWKNNSGKLAADSVAEIGALFRLGAEDEVQINVRHDTILEVLDQVDAILLPLTDRQREIIQKQLGDA